MKHEFEQEYKQKYTFENTDFSIDWCYLRHPKSENYELSESRAVLHGTEVTLDDNDSPTFIGIRQRDFCFDLSVDLAVDRGEAGVTVYMCESEHYDIAVRKTETGFEAVLKLNIGGIKHIQAAIPISSGRARLRIKGDNLLYKFFVGDTGLGCGQTKYLSSEVSGGFTGVVIGLYAAGDNAAEFENFGIEYSSSAE